jgi:hypothetical protein
MRSTRASTPVAQTSAFRRLSRSFAIHSGRRRCSTIHISKRFCESLSAYRSAAVLFKLSDVFVTAAQLIPRLVSGFCCATSFNAHGAERDGGTAVERCADCLTGRSTARQHAVAHASRAARQKSQHWAEAQNGGVVHGATSTVDPAPGCAGKAIVSAHPRGDTSSSLLDYYSTCCTTSRALPLMDHTNRRQTTGAGHPSKPGSGARPACCARCRRMRRW